jgi:hypothetical protein
MGNRTMAAALALVLAMGACREEEQPTDQMTGDVTPEAIRQARADWPAGLSEMIDSANTAYSAQDFTTASAIYRRAAVLAPEITAPWFGLYMAEHALGNTAAADSAMQRAQSLAPGASLIHGTPGDTALPPAHPDTSGGHP